MKNELKNKIAKLSGFSPVYKTADVGHGECRGWWVGNHFCGSIEGLESYADTLEVKAEDTADMLASSKYEPTEEPADAEIDKWAEELKKKQEAEFNG